MPRPLSYDRTLCFAVIALTCFGLVMVFSATTARPQPSLQPFVRQVGAALIGLYAMRRLMFRDYHEWRSSKIVIAAVAGSIILLLTAFLIGVGANTSRFLRHGQLSFQPSEAAKLALILFLAYHFERCADRIPTLRALAGGGLIFGALALLVLGGRDLGTVVAMMLIAAAMLFAAGLPIRYFLGGALAAAPLLVAAVVAEPYRLERLLIFWRPERDPLGAGFQLIQSKIAFGAGGWAGQGLMLGRQKMSFLPAAHTDFIFAVIGEELGMLGCLAVMAGFAVVLWRGLRTAARAPDPFGRYLAVGVTVMLVFQALINMGVAVGMLPTKGLPLPFISYGGSSLACSLAAAGILLSVSQYAE